MTRNVLVLSAVVSSLLGCASTYKQNVLTSPSVKLSNTASVLVATPTNGSYGSNEYAASGASSASAVRSAFALHSSVVNVSSNCRDIKCLRSEDNSAHDYYVVPEILHWEDRNTEWSGKSDKVEIKVSVFDGKNGNLLSSTVISGKSKWATFGGDHPQDLLDEPVNTYVHSLY